jgi:hypothetical protein
MLQLNNAQAQELGAPGWFSRVVVLKLACTGPKQRAESHFQGLQLSLGTCTSWNPLLDSNMHPGVSAELQNHGPKAGLHTSGARAA